MKYMHMNLVNTYAQLGATFSSNVVPQPLEQPRLVHRNQSLAEQLGYASFSDEDFVQFCNGKNLPKNSQSIAMVYAGHQFGSWVPRLGDGRAILVGEATKSDDTLYDLQIKGAGLTPYSRNGDGRAVLRSTIREYLCSEALHNLGIPTTRSLCMIDSETLVYREKTETGAAMIRVAESHVRFGTFEYFSYTKQYDALQALVDYVIQRHFPEWKNEENRVELLFTEAVKRTAELIAQWQSVGWCHGVMNTDNMSILGLTIDYGPFGFLDGFDAQHICNHSDWQGRYAFSRQPDIGYWNCTALAQALLPILPGGQESAQAILKTYPKFFAEKYSILLRAKFGFATADESDSTLIDQIFQQMQEEKTDYTIFFRSLCDDSVENLFVDREKFRRWYRIYQRRLNQEGRAEQDIRAGMLASNPKYILRNHLLQIAIDKAEVGEYSEIETLFTIMQKPFDEQPDYESYAELPPGWAGELEISCSS
ncbi:protein adenylyltransferase SelO [Parendozoicomonas sp. Alg238-R29]|uniref:protein adenylyltransferase SelO n=1 Tax=Parendozoicomonas sp. Alg238-R29 TaxID=2993446 RepID=UPI00248DC1A6|nr:YdiU family protein [Parendozoicomonas sp. Alg238-R29]